MAIRIGTLNAVLSLNSTRFTKGIKKARGGLTRLTTSLKSAKVGLGTFAAAMMGIAGGAGLARWVKHQFEAVDSLSKMSRTLGITTERLAGLNHAANLSAVPLKTMHRGLIMMSHGVSEAAHGMGPGIDALRMLGLDARKLQKMDMASTLMAVADALLRVSNHKDKVGALYDLAGAKAVIMLNLMEAGSAFIQKSIDRAHTLGLALASIETQTIEQANDDILEMGEAFRAIGLNIAVEIAPDISRMSEHITDMTLKAKGFRQVIADVADIFRALFGFQKAVLLAPVHAVQGAVVGAANYFESHAKATGMPIHNLGKNRFTETFSGAVRDIRQQFGARNEWYSGLFGSGGSDPPLGDPMMPGSQRYREYVDRRRMWEALRRSTKAQETTSEYRGVPNI